MKKLVIYPGRFQPFHKGHAQVFQWLKTKFGDAIIATTDKVEAPKSPFNFKEKKQMMQLAGVPAGKIKQVTNPYVGKEILKDYDPKTTVLIFAVSQKDMDEDPRFNFAPTKSGKPSYLQPYASNEKKLHPFGDQNAPQGYVVVAPTFTFDVLGKPATSASELRKQFVSLDNKKQKEFIKDLFGKYDEHIHKLMKDKIGAMMGKTIKKLKENFAIGLTFARKEMPQIGAANSFVKYLKSNDVKSKRMKVNPEELKSSQMEFDHDKIDGLRSTPSKNPIIVSNDNHVIDGHHRWLADKLEGRSCDAYVCNLPVLELLHQAKIYSKQLNEEVTHKELAPMLDSFVSFASDKLGIKSIPSVRYKSDEDDYNSFAAYSPAKNELSISTKNRHPMDVFRSIAHELVHHKQNEDGRLGKDIAKEGETGSDIENEANSEAGKIMRWFAKSNPNMFSKTHIVENTLHEGINDPGKLKAIFLAGGPGSGKDFVMNSSLAGEGLREINSDTAFEFLMKKHGLNMKMPEEEKVERDIVRGRAKNITKNKEKLSLSGRLGLIVNGTADDLEKIKSVKKELEALGYETMMVFVNTSNDVSKQRNLERGQLGGRKVPDGTDDNGVPNGTEDIRTEKWELAQKNIGELQKVFGNDKFVVIDNSADIRKVSPEVKAKVLSNFSRVRRMAQQFVRSDNNNPAAKKWIEGETEKRGITDYQEPKRYKTLTQVRQSVPNVVHKPDNELMAQARRLGLSYYGFGRFGRKVGNQNTVLYHSKGGQLVKVMNESKDPCWDGYEMVGMKKKNNKKVPNCVPVSEQEKKVIMSKKGKVKRKLISVNESFEEYMKKPSNREIGTPSLTNIYKSMTPGQEMKEDNVIPRGKYGLPKGGGLGPEFGIQVSPALVTGFGNIGNAVSETSDSIQKWANDKKTQAKFAKKYGKNAEKKLAEAALKLEQAGCGSKEKQMKSMKKIKETFGAASSGKDPEDTMGSVPIQTKD